MGNSWEIRFQEVIEATLKSDDYTKALGKLEKKTAEDNSGRYLRVNLVDYDFKDHRAYVDVKFEVINKGKYIFSAFSGFFVSAIMVASTSILSFSQAAFSASLCF